MHIQTSSETAEEFIARVGQLLTVETTHLYFDTSFLMWLTTLGKESRHQFVVWASTLNDRTHVPVWSMHEYYRHHTQRTVFEELCKYANAVDTATKAFAKEVHSFADGPLLPGKSETSYREALRGALSSIEELTAAARSWNYDANASDTLKWMNARACDTDIVFEQLHTVGAEGAARFEHRVPPGFEDRGKQDEAGRAANRYGDLLFWKEVVEDAQRRAAKNIIVVTDDRKKDWYFNVTAAAPELELRRLRARWDPVPVPHPLLVFEVGALGKFEGLDLLDHLYLGGILWSIGRPHYERFSAVAIRAPRAFGEKEGRPKTPIKPSKKRLTNSTIGLQEAVKIVTAAIAAEPASAHTLIASFETNAPDIDSFIDAFDESQLASLEPVDQVAVFGRLLHDQALIVSGPAQGLIAKIFEIFPKLEANIAARIYVGIIASAFYDGSVPRNRPASPYFPEIYSLQDDPCLEKVLKAFELRVSHDRSPALYFPNNSNRHVTIRIEHDASRRGAPAELFQIYCDGHAVLVASQARVESLLRAQFGDRDSVSVNQIAHAVCDFYGMPKNLINIEGGEPEETRFIPETCGLLEFDRHSLAGDIDDISEIDDEDEIPTDEIDQYSTLNVLDEDETE